MDEETRGVIEKMMDESFRNEILPDIEWLRNELPVSSLRDLALGHVVGHTQAISSALVGTRQGGKFTPKDIEEIKAMIKRRLPEVMEKIERELGR